LIVHRTPRKGAGAPGERDPATHTAYALALAAAAAAAVDDTAAPVDATAIDAAKTHREDLCSFLASSGLYSATAILAAINSGSRTDSGGGGNGNGGGGGGDRGGNGNGNGTSGGGGDSRGLDDEVSFDSSSIAAATGNAAPTVAGGSLEAWVPALVILHAKLGDHEAALQLLLNGDACRDGDGDGDAAAVAYCEEQAHLGGEDPWGKGEDEAGGTVAGNDYDPDPHLDDPNPHLDDPNLHLDDPNSHLDDPDPHLDTDTDPDADGASVAASRGRYGEGGGERTIPTLAAATAASSDSLRAVCAAPAAAEVSTHEPARRSFASASPGSAASAALLSIYLRRLPAPNLTAAVHLVEHRGLRLDAAAAAAMVPDDVPLRAAMPFLEAVFQRSVRDRNRAAMLMDLWRARRNDATAAMRGARGRAVVMTAETRCGGCGVSLGKPGGPLRPFAAVPRVGTVPLPPATTAAAAASVPAPLHESRRERRSTYRVVGPATRHDGDGGGGGGVEYELLCYRCHLSQEQSAGLFDEGDDGDEEEKEEEVEEVGAGAGPSDWTAGASSALRGQSSARSALHSQSASGSGSGERTGAGVGKQAGRDDDDERQRERTSERGGDSTGLESGDASVVVAEFTSSRPPPPVPAAQAPTTHLPHVEQRATTQAHSPTAVRSEGLELEGLFDDDEDDLDE
jgi:hypothetical protein